MLDVWEPCEEVCSRYVPYLLTVVVVVIAKVIVIVIGVQDAL